MIIPSQFKKLTKRDISKISDKNLKNILTIFSSKTNENNIGYLVKSSFSFRQRVYIRSKVLHDFSSRNENENITIDLIAKTIKSTIDGEELESLGNVNDIKTLLKKYLSNYQNRTTVVYSTLSILGEVVTMYVCSENLPKEMDFYDFLDQIYFLKWQPNRNLNHFNVYTDIRLSTEKISYMSAIYDAKLYDSIKVNYDNKESLVNILTNAFNKSYEYLSENDQQPLALLTAGGAWVEGMYLTTNVSEAAYNVATIAKILIDQKNSFMLYLDLTKPYMDNPAVSEFVNNLAPIKTVYDGLGTSLTEKNLADIKEAMAIIRNKIIQ